MLRIVAASSPNTKIARIQSKQCRLIITELVLNRSSHYGPSSQAGNLKLLTLRTKSSLSITNIQNKPTEYQNTTDQHSINVNHYKRNIHGTNKSLLQKCQDYDELCHIDEKMDKRLMYQFLDLKTFSKSEFETVFDEIHNQPMRFSNDKYETTTAAILDDVSDDADYLEEDNIMTANNNPVKDSALLLDKNDKTKEEEEEEEETINHEQITSYLFQRINDIEHKHKIQHPNLDKKEKEQMMMNYAREQARLLLNRFPSTFSSETNNSITKSTFTSHLHTLASTIDSKRTIPISLSMLLVGSSVGIVTPVMPFVVENLGLSAGEYGAVVSAFALAKIVGNVPSAILVERHGRKPYLVYSLSLISLGVGGVGLATCFEHLFTCRLFVGFGVAALSTAATMTIADISTPLNRASTMAPIMSAFAAGTALGPAIGGIMADNIGISPTFYAVGCSYLALTLVNRALLVETKAKPITFPWNEKKKNGGKAEESVSDAVQNAVGQWSDLMSDGKVKSVVAMNGFYWFALSGSQMTLLPLLLTDPTGLALSATSVGKVYMGMSLVQVLCNPTLAKFADKMGKEKAIVLGCTLISSSMATLPFCTDMTHMAGTLGLWSLGSTMLSTAPVAYVSDLVHANKRAQGIALLRTAGDVGFLLGAAGTGAVADWTGNLDVAMQSSAGLLASATGWFLARRFMEKKFEQQS